MFDEPLVIAVCEDSETDRQHLLEILKAASVPNLPTVFSSGEELLEHYEPQTYDLLLSDIYMDGMTGLDTVARIRELEPDLPIALVTSSQDHALESYRLSVLKYIEKPYDPQQIEAALQLAKINRDTAPALVMVIGGRETRVRFSQILYLEQQTHYVVIHARFGEPQSVYEKLSALLPQLEPQGFYSPHKSYSVNLNYVKSIDQELRCFLMADGGRIPIRRESMAQAKKALETHLFQRARGCVL